MKKAKLFTVLMLIFTLTMAIIACPGDPDTDEEDPNVSKFSITKGEITGTGNFTISPSGDQAAGTEITLTPTLASGYRLVSFSTDPEQTLTPAGANGAHTFKMPAANVTVKATFEAIPYTIIKGNNTGTGNGTYTISVNDSVTETATIGQVVTLTATPNETSGLVGFTTTPERQLTPAGENIFTFLMPAANVTVTANFGTVFTITITPPAFGNLTTNASNSRAVEGQDITITVTLSSGNQIDGFPTVTGASGAVVAVRRVGEGYNFYMPGENVTVAATINETTQTYLIERFAIDEANRDATYPRWGEFQRFNPEARFYWQWSSRGRFRTPGDAPAVVVTEDGDVEDPLHLDVTRACVEFRTTAQNDYDQWYNAAEWGSTNGSNWTVLAGMRFSRGSGVPPDAQWYINLAPYKSMAFWFMAPVITKERFDEDGNPLLDEDGNPVTVPQTFGFGFDTGTTTAETPQVWYTFTPQEAGVWEEIVIPLDSFVDDGDANFGTYDYCASGIRWRINGSTADDTLPTIRCFFSELRALP